MIWFDFDEILSTWLLKALWDAIASKNRNRIKLQEFFIQDKLKLM